ncbi:hypothetical protein NUW54_g5114 [Trametes sanguinea]|uniref:Uncharacterized protein n=1 Tax=Trametes sanguinea TaxID=158606 RepID=A0ACC1PVZ8_9APHY|nr:hypothetical protein NUW54_g5114 [Trametes sanguinea]
MTAGGGPPPSFGPGQVMPPQNFALVRLCPRSSFGPGQTMPPQQQRSFGPGQHMPPQQYPPGPGMPPQPYGPGQGMPSNGPPGGMGRPPPSAYGPPQGQGMPPQRNPSLNGQGPGMPPSRNPSLTQGPPQVGQSYQGVSPQQPPQPPPNMGMRQPYVAAMQMHHVPHPHAHARHHATFMNRAERLYGAGEGSVMNISAEGIKGDMQRRGSDLLHFPGAAANQK